MARFATPPRATEALVAELRAHGVDCSSRRLEDWRRVGLIPRGHRRSLGRGRGTEVVYPDDMAERCRRVAERMRRGQPRQVVALSLFAAGAELPDQTVRAAYRWALTIEPSGDEDELDVAERGVGQLLSTAAGQRLRALVTSHVKRSGVAPGEPPSALADGVLTKHVARLTRRRGRRRHGDDRAASPVFRTVLGLVLLLLGPGKRDA